MRAIDADFLKSMLRDDNCMGAYDARKIVDRMPTLKFGADMVIVNEPTDVPSVTTWASTDVPSVTTWASTDVPSVTTWASTDDNGKVTI